jgi:glycosyltransferase involved in cell wall biosynthesis
MIKELDLTIILPTLNEGRNLAFLIPDIFKSLEDSKFTFHILVIDDNSTDNTLEVINNLSQNYDNLSLYVRNTHRSLPLSIWDGVNMANSKYVMWLDADGSMDGNAVSILLKQFEKSTDKAIIGSRFVQGGGYKGVQRSSEKNFLKVLLNVKNSKDSVAGMVASIIFNKILYYIFNSEVKDVTSGFIVLKKDYVNKAVFQNIEYGEYFIYLVKDLLKTNIEIIEVGYVCLTRNYGESKTASSIIQLIKRGIPYIKATISSRIK